MQTRLCAVVIAIVWFAALGPASGGKRKPRDLSECVTGERGRVDMACLGGKSKGWSQLRVASSGVSGGIPGAEKTMLATRFAESGPSAAGKEIADRLAAVKPADIPAAWRKALVARGVAAGDAACPDMDRLLAGE